jgi:hypothetical protein
MEFRAMRGCGNTERKKERSTTGEMDDEEKKGNMMTMEMR